jgi:hypothetical protein
MLVNLPIQALFSSTIFTPTQLSVLAATNASFHRVQPNNKEEENEIRFLINSVIQTFHEYIEEPARSKIYDAIDYCIKYDWDMVIMGPPGGIHTGLLGKAARRQNALFVRLTCADSNNEKDFTKELLFSLEKPISELLTRHLKVVNKEKLDDKAQKLIYIAKKVDKKIAELEKTNNDEDHFEFFKEAVEVFKEACIMLAERTIVVIERVLEIRTWDSHTKNRKGKSKYEAYLRSEIKVSKEICYAILDISEEALELPGHNQNYIDFNPEIELAEFSKKEYDFVYFRLNPLSKKHVDNWTRKFLQDFCGYIIDDFEKASMIAYRALQGHTGYTSTFLYRLALNNKFREFSNIDRVENKAASEDIEHKASPEENGSTITLEDIYTVIDSMKMDSAPFAEAIMHLLNPTQKNLLRGIATENDLPIYSDDFRTKYKLGSRGSVQSAVESLKNKGLIYQVYEGKEKTYKISLPLLTSWLDYRVDSDGETHQQKTIFLSSLKERLTPSLAKEWSDN